MLYEYYVKPLVAARDIRWGLARSCTREAPDTPFLYIPIYMKDWSRETDKKLGDRVSRWLANEVEFRVPKVVCGRRLRKPAGAALLTRPIFMWGSS